MSSLIEQAAQRLEQLRQAGVVIPEIESPPAVAAPAVAGAAAVQPAAPARSTVVAPVRPTTTVEPGLDSFHPSATASKKVELNIAELEAAGILTPSSPRSRMSDQYRVVKRPLIVNATGQGASTITHANLIMVTSALPGEGKSFTSINLAMSIAAELDHTVMLVDADVARPSVLRMLGLKSSVGLLDVLEGKVELSEVLLRTNIDKLTVLPSGSPHPRATELLASDAMKALLDDMATRYPDRIIIFDSPPLLLTTESRVLATQMGQILVVVRADSTLQSSVQAALATIEQCPVKMMLLNRARDSAAGAYGGGYGYGYGYGQDATEQQAGDTAAVDGAATAKT
jgi:exopolysaccharide/PEP-CTERM locus tyrosine autokinase